MIKHYLFSISLLLNITLFAQSDNNEAKLMMVLQSWNDANNAKDIDTLSRLYASKITYYGSKLSRKKCIKDKKRLFKKYPHFSQSAQSTAYSALSPQLYKIIFDKHVRIKPGSKSKVYPSYLLVNTSSAFPAIVEEGDSVTDKNIKRNNVIPTYTIGDTHELKGKIETVLHYGPPGYGEDPQNDQKITAYILKLEEPINAVALMGDEVNFSTQTTEIQLLAFDYLSQLEETVKKRKVVRLRGEFFSAHTGYHIRDVLMDVKSIK